MSLSSAQRGGFEDRLARIKHGGPNTMGAVHVGPVDEEKLRKGKDTSKVKIKRSKKNVAIGQGNTPVLMVLGLIFGAIAMFVGKATAFHLLDPGGLMPLTLPEQAAPALPYAQFIVAGTLGLMLAWTFRMTSILRLAAVIGGAYALFHFHTDLVAEFPMIYTNFFTEAYVAETLASA